MNLKKWFESRGTGFVWQRATALLDRYGVAPDKATQRIDDCIDTLTVFGCAPTFPTPGIVVQRYPQFVRHLQDVGAEIAVHSYQHIDLRTMPLSEARQQLVRAVRTFECFGIQVYGFRCPYLGHSAELLDSLPGGMFDYSSNEAIYCEPDNLEARDTSDFFETLRRFYQGRPFSETACLPSTRSNFIEIPVCVPDDLQLHDGLHLGGDETGEVWSQMLDQIYQRGELFTLIFHPELASFCESAFVSLLRRAHQFCPPVWIARLSDISQWWREKSGFKVESFETPTALRLSFMCSPHGTILVRGLDPGESGQPWDGAYYQLQSRILDVPTDPRPFVGLPASAPGPVVAFLQEQGYIVDTSGTATRCAICLDTATLDRLTEVQLIDHIEALPGPLVRYWRWPDGAKCALSVTGDLDALTLLDYAARLFVQ